MRIRETFLADSGHIGEMVRFVSERLERCEMKKKDRIMTELTVEEAVSSLIAHSDASEHTEPDASEKLCIELKGSRRSLTVELSLKGEEYSLADEITSASISVDDDTGTETQAAIRNIILSSVAGGLKYRHRKGVNYIRMFPVRPKRAFLCWTLGALTLGAVLGLLCTSFVPETVNTALNTYFLVPVKTMYMNALKMIVAPVVFFSIISCIVGFSDLSSLGRIGGKIMGLYLLTTVIAVSVGIGAFYLLKPGRASLAAGLMQDASSITTQTIDVSVKDMIVNIIPQNIIDPFQQSNMLQLIFLAVLLGVGAGLIGKYSQMLRDLFQALNDLFLKVTGLIIKLMPVAVFCSVMSLILSTGIGSVLSLLEMLGTFVFGLLIMAVVYSTMILLIGRLNPLPFVRKYAPYMLQVFSMSSSNAAIPLNMEACGKRLGIHKNVYSLSVPLGATVNMDGTCIYLAVFALTLAHAYGVQISGASMISLIITIIVLSIGAPGIPGAGLICLSVLLAQINVPLEAVGLVMGIDALCAMFRAMSNSYGDIAASLIVAKSEKKLDLNVYRAK